MERTARSITYVFEDPFALYESRKIERTRPPRDPMEEWLESQTPTPKEVKHEDSPKEAFQAWKEKRLQGSKGERAELRVSP